MSFPDEHFENSALLRRSVERATRAVTQDLQLRDALSSSEASEQVQAARTSIEVLETLCRHYGERPALGSRPSDGRPEFRTLSYAELWQRVVAVATGLRAADLIGSGETVGFCGFGNPDYVVADFACLFLSLTTVHLQPRLTRADLAHCINEAEIRSIVCDVEELGVLMAVLPQCPGVRNVIVIDALGTEAGYEAELAAHQKAFETNGIAIPVTRLDAVERAGRKAPSLEAVIPPPGTNPVVTLVYTSGSTGAPKAAIFLETNWIQVWKKLLIPSCGPEFPWVAVHFMPLNHMIGRLGLITGLAKGGTTYFVHKTDMSTLFEDIRLVRPTIVCLVPRIAETIYHEYRSGLVRRSAAGDDEAPREVQQQVMEELRSSFLGDRLLIGYTTTAPTAPEISRFLKDCFQIPIFNLYGATESGQIAQDHRINRGLITDYKLVDIPELRYHTTDKPYPRGELRVKSTRAIAGYFKAPKPTSELFDEEGFSKTGDVVEERGPDHIVWIDRVKNILKLSQGEFVSISRLESVYAGGSPFIRQVYLYGNSLRSYLLAVIVPDRSALQGKLPNAGDDEVRAFLRAEVQHVAQAADLRTFEVPREIIVAPAPFSKENGLLLDSNKLSRPNLLKAYGPRLEAIYAELERQQREGLMDLRRAAGAGVSVADKVKAALEAALGLAHVDLSAKPTFASLGGASLDATRFSALLHELTGAAIPASAILNPSSSIGDLVKQVEAASAQSNPEAVYARIHGPDAAVGRADDLRISRFLTADEMSAARALARVAPDVRPNVVLLTGANGFLGRFVLVELMARLAATGKIYCIVRAPDNATAYERLRAGFARSEPAMIGEIERLHSAKRLVVLAGDLTAPKLGLPGEVYEALALEVDAVMHNGALVNHAFSYEQLFEPNVLGTVEVIRFASKSRIKSIHFTSSVGVAMGLTHDGPIREDEDARTLAAERPLGSGYAQGYGLSKWAGELLLRDAEAELGVPVNVFRCSMILAHREARGEINPADYFTRLLCGLAYARIAPASFYTARNGAPAPHFDALAVDFVARTIANIVTDGATGYATYHLVNSHWDDGVSLDAIVGWMKSFGYAIERIGDHQDWYRQFQARLAALPKQKSQRSPLPVIYQWEKPIPVLFRRFSTTRLRERLAQFPADRGLPSDIPPLTEAFIHKCLADMQYLGLIEAPSAASSAPQPPGAPGLDLVPPVA